ncbi:MAG: endolytic transglycosylase MltG [Gammaproteobacteria bacterium]|nr:endolytic transglycosylase MltG [Gammaproteobacteria bacterium]
MNRWLLSGLAIFVAACVAVGLLALQVNRFMNTELDVPETGVAFEIPAGSSFASVSRRLVEQEIVSGDRWLRLYARWHKLTGAIQAGDYLIEKGATPESLLQQFTTGDVRLYSFTIIEGWSYREVLAALHRNAAIEVTMTDEDWPALLESLGANHTHPEGMFLPETYNFPSETTDKALLGQAYQLMQKVLAEEWPNRAEDAPVKTPYEALILASIVEKETARTDERPRIAGVFARRLQKRMRLQTDPTVIYGIGPAFDGNITRKHLRTDTPYNTYTRHGLPPTPIAMPGRDAIRAALNPASGEELYFVATGLDDGSHKFSATKAEHDAAVAEYLRRLRQRRNGS